ncbi:DUF2326 domain-containing protein [Pseudarthrobacter sp. NPDC055928]|uniref:DUF2326 domain-containing protein n=1 Tax=Pseudarthrobacter sp. NPDC055928 TaxID=3345661 RepID=UPI0035DD901A
MCMAFDLAVLSAHLGSGFPRFVYHDGAFESLDSRKKRSLWRSIVSMPPSVFRSS